MWLLGFPFGPHTCKPLPWLQTQGQICDNHHFLLPWFLDTQSERHVLPNETTIHFYPNFLIVKHWICVLLNIHIRTLFASFLCSWYVSWANFINNTLTSCSVRNMFIFNSHVFNMMLLTCYLCFAIIWNIASPSFNCSITKCLIYFNKWAANANLSSIFISPWICTPFCLTWFHWMKHIFDTCLNKYNVLMVNLTLHPFFYKTTPFFLGILYALVACH